MYNTQGITVDFPTLDCGGYLLEHLENMGFYMSSGMGMIPLTFQEIKAYMELTNNPLNSEEVLLIRQMSQAYIAELNDTRNEREAPYSPTTL